MGAAASSTPDEVSPELFRRLQAEYESLKSAGADEATMIAALRAAAASHTAPKPAKRELYSCGDKVTVKMVGAFLHFQATILEQEEDEGGSLTYRVAYLSGLDNESAEEESGVAPSRIRRVQTWRTLEVGDTVKVKEAGSRLEFEGRVVALLPEERILVDYGVVGEDGTPLPPEEAAEADCRKLTSTRITAITKAWQKAFSSVNIQLKASAGFRTFKKDECEGKDESEGKGT